MVTYTANLRSALRELCVQSTVLAGETREGAQTSDVVDLGEVPRARLLRGAERLFSRVAPEVASRLRTSQQIAAAVRALCAHGPLDLLEMEESFGLAELVGILARVPVIVRLHGPWFSNAAALGLPQNQSFHRRNRAERAAIARAAGVSAPSYDVLRRVRQAFELELPDAEVIPNPGMPVACEQHWSLDTCDRNEILAVGRFDRMKGGDLTVRAFRKLAVCHPHLRLTLVGPDHGVRDERGSTYTLDEFLQRELPDAEHRARVRILGTLPLSQLAPLRKRAFLTVVASRYETFSMTTLEALAAGSPVVASDVGGIAEIVRHGENGLTFQNGNADALAARIQTLLDAPALAARLAARGLEDFDARFSPRSVARRTLAFYEQVLERHDRRARLPFRSVAPDGNAHHGKSASTA